MKTIHGKGVYGGIAVGKLKFFSRGDISVKRKRTDDPKLEAARFESAKAASVKELEALYDKAQKEVGRTNAEIFEIHRMMTLDEDYSQSVLNIIDSQSVNAEYAVAVTADNFAMMFSAMEDDYMQARSADVKDISNRILKNLGAEDTHGDTDAESDEPFIVCADDLAPSETVMLDKSRVIAFATAYGSANSHTAILARTMNIPAIIGLGEELLDPENDRKTVIADGFAGTIVIDPDENALAAAERMISEEQKKRELLVTLKGKPNTTIDGKTIKVFANIGGINDIGAVLLNDAGGIGLFRSEFLYLESKDMPTEEEQFSVYRRVLESMAGKPVIIRTLDAGADKQIPYLGLEREENPAMGFRAIRLCLEREDIFRTQLRALFRAALYGTLGIMFPMITSVSEVERIIKVADDVKASLAADGIPFGGAQLGIMIETPAAAIISDLLAPMVDFFSVGTNDLSQYTCAIDRQNPRLDSFFDPHHEAVMRLIELSCKNAHAHGKWIGICGELGADTSLTERFIRMGIDELSVSPPAVLKVRQKIRSLELN